MTEFSGVRVLIVEDEFTVAMMIEDALEALGCEIVSSASRIAQARDIAEAGDIDVAVLDVNVAGTPVFPIAQILHERQIPFLFSTGYGAGSVPDEFSGYELVGKPFSESELTRKLSLTLKGAQ